MAPDRWVTVTAWSEATKKQDQKLYEMCSTVCFTHKLPVCPLCPGKQGLVFNVGEALGPQDIKKRLQGTCIASQEVLSKPQL